jgi:hypothetical protein
MYIEEGPDLGDGKFEFSSAESSFSASLVFGTTLDC